MSKARSDQSVEKREAAKNKNWQAMSKAREDPSVKNKEAAARSKARVKVKTTVEEKECKGDMK